MWRRIVIFTNALLSKLQPFAPTLVAFAQREIAPASFRRMVLDLAWYLFIMLVVGQLGPLLTVGHAVWTDRSVGDTLDAQANSGTLLTFSVALLAGSAYFVVKEFHGDGAVKRAHVKSPLLLCSIGVGFTGALVCAVLASNPSYKMTAIQMTWHWLLYWSCIGLALIWWCLEETQGALVEFTGQLQDRAGAMTAASHNLIAADDLKV